MFLRSFSDIAHNSDAQISLNNRLLTNRHKFLHFSLKMWSNSTEGGKRFAFYIVQFNKKLFLKNLIFIDMTEN